MVPICPTPLTIGVPQGNWPRVLPRGQAFILITFILVTFMHFNVFVSTLCLDTKGYVSLGAKSIPKAIVIQEKECNMCLICPNEPTSLGLPHVLTIGVTGSMFLWTAGDWPTFSVRQ